MSREGYFSSADVDLDRVHAAMTKAGRRLEGQRLDRIQARNLRHELEGGRICEFQNRDTGQPCTFPARRWMNFWACVEQHQPALLPGGSGRPAPTPHPDWTADGARRKWYADRGLPYVPWSSTLSSSAMIDDRNVASGKKRGTDAQVRMARRS